jgi:hypothetical protein
VASPLHSASTAQPEAPSVNNLILAYWRYAEQHYRTPDGAPTGELDNIRDALGPLRRLYGRSPARNFGPLALRAVREEMVRSDLARTTINARINRIRRLFRWATGVELVPVGVYEALRAVGGDFIRHPRPPGCAK